MTTITEHSDKSVHHRKRGFTLVELIIAVSISSTLLYGTTSSYIFLLKSSMSIGQYVEQNNQDRLGLELFGRDMRMAENVTTATSSQVIVDIPTETGTRTVEYIYQPGAKRFVRIEGTWEKTIFENVGALSLSYFNIVGNATTNIAEVKKVQFEVLKESQVLQIEKTSTLISAKYMMRNREVSN